MRRESTIRIRSIRRPEPELRKLSRALIALAMASAEAEEQAAAKADAETVEPADSATADQEPAA